MDIAVYRDGAKGLEKVGLINSGFNAGLDNVRYDEERDEIILACSIDHRKVFKALYSMKTSKEARISENIKGEVQVFTVGGLKDANYTVNRVVTDYNNVRVASVAERIGNNYFIGSAADYKIAVCPVSEK
jgi:hypothetical protein